jgi:YesN/AraC family two-component response regulator
VSAVSKDNKIKQEFIKICDDYISKPFNYERLLESLKKLMNLQWIYRETSTDDRPISPDAITGISVIQFPQVRILERIRKKVNDGFFGEVEAILADLVSNNHLYKPFQEKMMRYIESCDDDGIIAFIDKNF